MDKGVCDKRFIWNPSNYGCECHKSCDIGEYLDYQNCKCRKKLADKLTEECAANIDETRLVEKDLTEFNFVENKFKHNFCTLYIVLFSIVFTINVGIATYFVYSHWCLKKDVARINFGTCTQTTI